MLSEGDANGTWQRFIIIAAPGGPNTEGRSVDRTRQRPEPEHLLARQPVSEHRRRPGQTKECEAGNEDYVSGRQHIGNVPGNQGTVTADQPKAKK